MSQEFKDEDHWCQHCNKSTSHHGRYSTHERDSTDDWFICDECGWEYSGYTGRYSPPLEPLRKR